MPGTIGDIAAAEPAFMVERFEAEGERLEVAGHWRGLRGRRFVRPVLWLYHGEDRRRLVAVLDHKPWAAGEGDQWIAAFPWTGGKLDAERAELEVGRELVVELPVPGRPTPAVPQPAAPRRPTELERVREELADERRERRALQDELEARTREAGTLARLRAERDAARAEAEQARADGERLVNDEYRQRERALAAAEEAGSRVRDTEAERDLAQRQLGAARASYAELEQRLAVAETAREEAEAARDELASRLAAVEAQQAEQGDLAERLAAADKARADLKRRLAATEAARADHRALVEQLTAAEAARDDLRSRLTAAEAARTAPPDDLAAERERLEREVAAAWAERDRLEAELLAARAGRERVEAELVEERGERKRLSRLAVDPPAPRPARWAAPESRLAPPRAGIALWVVRLVALALVALLAVAVALVLGPLV